MTADDFLDRARELQRLAKRLGLAHLHDQARDATRRRFLAEIAK